MRSRSLSRSSLTGENRLVSLALAGDIHAADRVLQYLGSSNPNLRKIMLDTIQSLNQIDLYQQLLHCLACGEWEIHTTGGQILHCSRRSEPLHAERIESSIIELFCRTGDVQSSELIETILTENLHSSLAALRHTAAYLLALRGDAASIPVLAEAIEQADLVWKIRAVRALADLADPRSGPPLVRALAMPSDKLHEEARRALGELGEKAEPAWIDALKHPKSHIRWHAARGLGEIGDDRAIAILAAGLMEENHAVRWATARVLARLDAAAVPAILNLISCNPMNESFRQAAYHALHSMSSHQTQIQIAPLLVALKNPAADIGAPGVARRLLAQWK